MPLPIREARKLLRKAGFEHTATNSHEKWSHPDGRTVTLPHHPRHDGLYGFMEKKIRMYAKGQLTKYERSN